MMWPWPQRINGRFPFLVTTTGLGFRFMYTQKVYNLQHYSSVLFHNITIQVMQLKGGKVSIIIYLIRFLLFYNFYRATT